METETKQDDYMLIEQIKEEELEEESENIDDRYFNLDEQINSIIYNPLNMIEFAPKHIGDSTATENEFDEFLFLDEYSEEYNQPYYQSEEIEEIDPKKLPGFVVDFSTQIFNDNPLSIHSSLEYISITQNEFIKYLNEQEYLRINYFMNNSIDTTFEISNSIPSCGIIALRIYITKLELKLKIDLLAEDFSFDKTKKSIEHLKTLLSPSEVEEILKSNIEIDQNKKSYEELIWVNKELVDTVIVIIKVLDNKYYSSSSRSSIPELPVSKLTVILNIHKIYEMINKQIKSNENCL